MRVPGQVPLAILVCLAACTWFVVGVLLYGARPDMGFFKPMSIVVGITATALAAYDRWLWRTLGLPTLHGIPDLNGTWFGEIRSMWTNPATGIEPAALPVALVIRQTYSALSLRMFTGESTSVSLAAGLQREIDGRIVVSYLFRNEPALSVQDNSRVHHGGARLALGGDRDVLDGSYWTDRDSKGEMTLRRVSRARALDLEAAQRLAPAKRRARR